MWSKLFCADRNGTMTRLMTLLVALFLISTAWSQEVEEAAEEVGPEVAEAAETAVAAETDEEEDDADLDEQGYGLEEEEDDFIPSQEVSADQSLPFPVDI
jgi:hypothetical protein